MSQNEIDVATTAKENYEKKNNIAKNIITLHQKKQKRDSKNSQTKKTIYQLNNKHLIKKSTIMKTKKNLSKSMFMSIITTVVFCFGFAACSNDNLDNPSEGMDAAADRASEEANYQPYGLTYHNFENIGDVQILDPDTTEIAVKKSLADKMGIITFVNHPIGIWDSPSHLAYGRKVLEEKLIGDTYILKVKEATVAELVGDKLAQLSTDMYVNQDTNAVKASAAESDVPEYAVRYMDKDGMYHPAVIQMTGSEYEVVDGQEPAYNVGNSRYGEYDYITAEDFIAKDPSNGSRRVLNVNKTFNLKCKIPVGKDAAAIEIAGKLPVNYNLNYTLTLDPGLKWDRGLKAYVKKFETGLDGEFGIHPQATISFKSGLSLPEDKGKIKLVQFQPYIFTFMVGPVPVVITVEPELNLKFDASVSGAINMGFQYDYSNTFKAGIKFEDNRWSVNRGCNVNENKFSLNRPEVQLKAEAGIGLFLTTAVKVYGIAGPELGVGPRIGAEATMTASDKGLKFNAEANMKLQAWAGAKIGLLGFNIAEWSTRFDIFGPWQIWKYSE